MVTESARAGGRSWNPTLGEKKIRHSVRAKGAFVLLAACGLALGQLPLAAPSLAEPTAAVTQENPYLVGAGVADMTGEPAEVGFMGYGDSSQTGTGLMNRQFARAFEVKDPASGESNLIVVLDQLTATESVRDEVIQRVQQQWGSDYGESNIMITASHTHAAPGGVTRYSLYNVTTLGWHQDTFEATVDGAMEAINRAHADLAPGNLTVSQSKLTGVGAQRSAEAQANDPAYLTDELVDGVDPTNITLRLERDGQTRALINWFAIHPTSLTSKNTLVSTDNKGYAQWLIEHEDHGVDHYSGTGDGFVAAFANSNTGDVSPNTNLRPGSGPTEDQVENMKIQGTKQAEAVRAQLAENGDSVGEGLDSAIHYADFSNIPVMPKFSGTGKVQHTCDASLGQSFAAGSVEDGGGGLDVFGEGVGANPFFGALAEATYKISPELKECQAPKDNLLAVGAVDAVQEKLPVQIMRFGDYYILGLPGEMTGAVGVQYRKDMAELFGVDESHIIVQGYTNAYAHYVTTPEEYDAQQYEGGATIFGRYSMGAFRQVLNTVGLSMRENRELELGEKAPTPATVSSAQGKVLYDLPGAGKQFGEQTVAPADTSRGETVSAEFVGAHPNNNLKHGSSYLEIQRFDGQHWVYVTGDNDPETTFSWQRRLAAQSRVTISWNIPADAEAGTYRIVYHGDSKDSSGKITPFTGTSSEFQVK